MRHVIVVVGSKAQQAEPAPDLMLRGEEPVRTTTWFAGTSGQESASLLDDMGSTVVRYCVAPILMYRLYSLVHNTKLWSGKRPLVLVRGRSLASRVAAYAGSWGGGDIVEVVQADVAPLAATRYLLDADGNLRLRSD